MARECEITGKSTQIGGRYSNRTRATQFNPTGKVRRKANLQKRRVFVPELNKTVLVDISVAGLRHIKKNGAFKTLKKAGLIKKPFRGFFATLSAGLLLDPPLEERMPRPILARAERSDFPSEVKERTVNDYRVFDLPPAVRKRFDDGAHVVRISSIELATLIPDYGGKTSGERSLPMHQDHFAPQNDPRRFLMLSQAKSGARGSSTIVMTPETAAEILPLEEEYFLHKNRRIHIGRERRYDERFAISKKQYHRCFDYPQGYEQVVREMLRKGFQNELAVRLGILGYLTRGIYADRMMAFVLRRVRGSYLEEKWEEGGVVIIDNERTYHGRLGGNFPPLKRNYCT